MRRLLPAFALLLAAGAAQAAQVQVAVAANFTAPAKKIAAAFERATGHQALLAFGSTGRFHAQVKNGAPYHVLLAADETTPRQLAEQGLAVAGSQFTYAVGRLVLWSPKPGFVDDQGAILHRGGFERLAMADPKLAPYGAAAMQAIAKLQLPRGIIRRIVQGESIAQAWQFVASGNAQLGFVALAQVLQDGQPIPGSHWVVPAHLHEPLRQGAILLNAGRDHAAARAWLDFLRSDAGKAVIRAHGYEVP